VFFFNQKVHFIMLNQFYLFIMFMFMFYGIKNDLFYYVLSKKKINYFIDFTIIRILYITNKNLQEIVLISNCIITKIFVFFFSF
jgi:hypothetical protein